MVLADNATTEYQFISTFFGRPSDMPQPSRSTGDVSDFTASLSKGWESISRSEDDDDEGASSADETASVITRTNSEAGFTPTNRQKLKEDNIRRGAANHVWKQIMEGPLEYCKV